MSKFAIAHALKKKAKKMAVEPSEKAPVSMEHGERDLEPHEMDMVERLMRQRDKMYSGGGVVSNEGHGEGLDDLVQDDHLEEHYTADNSGDKLGNEQESDDREDIISRIMKSRAKKDKMPRPA